MSQSFLQEIRLTNLLSYGPETQKFQLEPLNVLIGPNGSGKSNLLEAISLLRAAPMNLSVPVKELGGVKDWLWKGSKSPIATIEAVISHPDGDQFSLRHTISFTEHGQRFEIIKERIEYQNPLPLNNTPYSFYINENGKIRIDERNGDIDAGSVSEQPNRPIQRDFIQPEESILSQVKDPERYPYLSFLSENYRNIRQYRDWVFGRYTPPRQPQKSDLPSQYLSDRCENLALVLNALRPRIRKDLTHYLSMLLPQTLDFDIQIFSGLVQLFLEIGNISVPATRLSDGTLRYLCLLAILLHPDPPPLVCIEEPELGLHPDILPTIADLLVEASKNSQIIVTTHSDILVDALTSRPESVVICEMHDNQTILKRLDPNELKVWLEKYRLGQLWIDGQIGGTR